MTQERGIMARFNLHLSRERKAERRLGRPGRCWILPSLILLAAVLAVVFCGKEERTNPLDPRNPQTGGDPFGLVAEVQADGVHLSWSIPEGPEIALIRVLRRDDLSGAYTPRTNLGPSSTTWTDGTIANGHTYEYKVIAVDRDGRTSSESSVREVRVDTDPVWTLNDGQPFATTRTVPVTLLATTAVSMRLIVGTDTSGVEWVPATGTPSVTLGAAQGTHKVSGQVRYDDGSESPLWTGSVILDTDPPLIAISQTSLDVNTRTVTMSAEGTLDHSDICPVDSLTYKWAWGDGTTHGPSTLHVDHSHRYTSPGPWTITLTVTDLAGHEADTTWFLPLPNQPPSAPVLSSPAADADDVSRTASLAWRASVDPEGDAVTYNVHHGPAGGMSLVAGDIADTTLSLSQRMDCYTLHEWRVVAVDAWGDSAASPVRSFTTGPNQPPTTPSDPDPEHGAIGVDLEPILRWAASVDPEGTQVLYDVFFGTVDHLSMVSEKQEETAWTPVRLAHETTYHWRIMAWDEDGARAEGEVWSLTTRRVPEGFVYIQSGIFTMGSPTNELGRNSDETQHQVTLTKAFYIGVHEVTQIEWQEVMGWNPSEFVGADRPVESVTWFDCVDFCNRKSGAEGLTEAYILTNVRYSGNHITSATVTWNRSANGYRLPTEAEWEYACRAGSTTAFCNGAITRTGCSPVDPNLNQVGWYCGNADSQTHNVGQKSPNAWGLYDMHGNVWEWCWNWYAAYGNRPVIDPIGSVAGSDRVARGGCGGNDAEHCRSAVRNFATPGDRANGLGFRLARTAQ